MFVLFFLGGIFYWLPKWLFGGRLGIIQPVISFVPLFSFSFADGTVFILTHKFLDFVLPHPTGGDEESLLAEVSPPEKYRELMIFSAVIKQAVGFGLLCLQSAGVEVM